MQFLKKCYLMKLIETLSPLNEFILIEWRQWVKLHEIYFYTSTVRYVKSLIFADKRLCYIFVQVLSTIVIFYCGNQFVGTSFFIMHPKCLICLWLYSEYFLGHFTWITCHIINRLLNFPLSPYSYLKSY